MSLSIIILAAGKGTRMKSARPKVLHPVAGKAMLQHVVDTGRELDPDQVLVVIGHESEQIEQAMQGQGLDFILQQQQLGTGHAVMQCQDCIKPGNDLLVLYGDVPLIRASTLQALVEQGRDGNVVSLLTFVADDPKGYGRIVRDRTGHVNSIIEEKDASEDIRKIRECNSGIMYIKGTEYQELLGELDNNNVQSEYYLTDVVKHAVTKKHLVSAVQCSEIEVLGVNNQLQLAQIEAIYRQQKAEELMGMGIKLVDPARIDVRGTLSAGKDVSIDANCIFEGQVELGDNVIIEANCVIRDSVIGSGSVIHCMSVIEKALIGEQNDIGPFARVRPDTVTESKAKIGNFVEIKKSHIGQGSKVNHLTYIGDTTMGSNVNIGAGTITCNYDGAYKHQTIIGDNVFVGSDTQLVAPVTLADGTTIGAGSTITRDTEAGRLTLSRSKQTTINGWQRPTKDKS